MSVKVICQLFDNTADNLSVQQDNLTSQTSYPTTWPDTDLHFLAFSIFILSHKQVNCTKKKTLQLVHSCICDCSKWVSINFLDFPKLALLQSHDCINDSIIQNISCGCFMVHQCQRNRVCTYNFHVWLLSKCCKTVGLEINPLLSDSDALTLELTENNKLKLILIGHF